MLLVACILFWQLLLTPILLVHSQQKRHQFACNLCCTVGTVDDCRCEYSSLNDDVKEVYSPLLKDLHTNPSSHFKCFPDNSDNKCPYGYCCADNQYVAEKCAECQCEEKDDEEEIQKTCCLDEFAAETRKDITMQQQGAVSSVERDDGDAGTGAGDEGSTSTITTTDTVTATDTDPAVEINDDNANYVASSLSSPPPTSSTFDATVTVLWSYVRAYAKSIYVFWWQRFFGTRTNKLRHTSPAVVRNVLQGVLGIAFVYMLIQRAKRKVVLSEREQNIFEPSRKTMTKTKVKLNK